MRTFSIEEKEQYLKEYKDTGSQDAKENLIIAYSGLVKLLANKLYVQNVNTILTREDYEQYGILGLLDAIEKFSFDFNVKFETYASQRIRGQIIDSLRGLSPLKRSGLEKKKVYQEAVTKTIEKYGFYYTREQFIEVSGKTEEELIEIERMTNMEHACSIESLFQGDDDDDSNKLDIRDTTFLNGEDRVLKRELFEKVRDAIDKLTERERQVIYLIYVEECTYVEISKILGVTESRISQLAAKSLAKLKTYLSYYVNM